MKGLGWADEGTGLVKGLGWVGEGTGLGWWRDRVVEGTGFAWGKQSELQLFTFLDRLPLFQKSVHRHLRSLSFALE